jgi:molecular chaperone Hsp33
MLKPSRLYSFLDPKSGFALHFLDGQKLIYDLALIHTFKGAGFAFFRDMVLSFMPMISFLKPGENLGIYIDSEEPYFRLKIETSFGGQTRTLLLPENFSEFPIKLTGSARVTKQFPGGRAPYTSVVSFKETNSKDVINDILRTSYQANSEIVVSDIADQSVMVIKLPPMNVNNKSEDETPTLEEFIKTSKTLFQNIFDENHNDTENVVKAFEKSQFAYLSSRQVELFCPCSKDRMIDNLRMLFAQDPEALFAGKNELEAKCDYCKKAYEITRTELSIPATHGPVN